MQITRNGQCFQKQCKHSVVTIGSFDGMHRGHQALLSTVKQNALKHGYSSVVISFEPLPKEFFLRQPARLMGFRQKYLYLKAQAVDLFLCLTFNQYLAQMDAQAFVEQILVNQLQTRVLVVGHDFNLGHKRAGPIETLSRLCEKHQISLIELPEVTVSGQRVSSSQIRGLLANRQLSQAALLLGRPFSICGKVVRGAQLGRVLGYPTANISFKGKISPLHGVFVVAVQGARPGVVYGAASLGFRPAVGGKVCLLEVFLFDYNENIYGHILEVTFMHCLRDEADFGSLDALKKQIAQDVRQAKEYLRHNKHLDVFT